MCGLTFLFSAAEPVEALRQRTSAALRRIAHRGPDDEGLLQLGAAAIGHRRLSIIDLQGSRQPMADASGRFVLAYNGEVYNYRALRERLLRRWPFRTHGDTEVVLAGLASEGPRFLEEMDGMWALALWDAQTQTLLLARDRMGKKPLYYQPLADGLASASELSALAALVAAPWSEDDDSTADYLRYGYYLPGTTAYRGVREVLPGHWAKWRPGESVTERPYWSLRTGGYSGTEESAAASMREALTEAVRKRLEADVEVGAFLSGGVDSSLVVGILTRHCGVTPKTFSIGFDDPAYDERHYARLAAQTFATDHFEETLAGWDRQTLETLVLKHVGQPFADSSLLPTALVSELAARKVKVSLSGDGGDELFAGYQRYQARLLLRWYTRLPAPLRNGVERLLGRMPEPMAHHSRSLLKKAHLFLDIVRRQESERPYVAPVMYSREVLAHLAPELAGRGHAPPALPVESQPDDLEAMMAGDALVYLPQDILVKVDRASMAHALEARAPFLDRRVVELAFALPGRWHRRMLSGKRVLRAAFGELLPASIWSRRKQGFAVPVHRWLRAEMGNELERLLATVAAPLAPGPVHKMLAEHRAMRRDHGYRLWALYVYLLWRERGARPAS
ncbi:MAG: asparagine synthase (glutamine-hydrolyzing) [Gammaproteobacteria bacterium]|nr:asparagine synthase (glutamine-hydrolyzing) [Gammaproteobacteria bacterium]